jgi:outer membrane protein OmpA-like peptidoglycan-associated protein
MVTTEGFGQTKPMAPNDTPQGRAEDRHVEFLKV